jgi:hypothetical protein
MNLLFHFMSSSLRSNSIFPPVAFNNPDHVVPSNSNCFTIVATHWLVNSILVNIDVSSTNPSMYWQSYVLLSTSTIAILLATHFNMSINKLIISSQMAGLAQLPCKFTMLIGSF